jgi:PAS domain S-box-containing protein
MTTDPVQRVPSPDPTDELRHEVEALREQVAQLTRSGHELISTQTRMHSLLHRATDGIIQFESDGTISSFNSAAERIFDYPEIEMLHRHGDRLFLLPDHFRRNVPAYLLHYVETTTHQYETPLIGLRRDGSPVLLEVSIAEIASEDLVLFDDFSDDAGAEEGSYEAFLCILRDITERKRVDEELRQHRENLEQLVAEQVEEIRQAQADAERANQAKSAFLASMSHELRTPMHAILSYSDFGLKKLGSANVEKLGQYFDRINSAGRRLLGMIDGLLDLSKAEAGQLVYHMAKTDLVAVVADILTEYESLRDQAGLEVVFSPESGRMEVELDGERVGQVVRNLLSNAFRFSPQGGKVEVVLTGAVLVEGGREVPAIALRVADAGPGIPDQDLARIFERFIQSSRTAKRGGGTGLGLAIAREIVHGHHGTITASNRAGGGACFEALLPLRQTGEKA